MRKILVVDDNATSRKLMRHVLKPLGHVVVEAEEGQEALRMIKEEEPDLVLLDIEMPHLDGVAVVHQLRRNPCFAGLPVVAVTANAMQGDREKALAAGFDGYITKPISGAALREEVGRLLGL
jgi:CheY-like chemotaxis protein